MRIVFLAIGDELLRGELRESNSADLADHLGRVGLQLAEVRVLSDDSVALASALRGLRGQPTALVISGGLGPTDDDGTRAAVALACELPLLRDEASVDHIAARFARLGRTMHPANLRQAEFPAGAQVLANRHGTAPAFAMQSHELHLLCLPGVPREFNALLAEHLPAWLVRLGLGRPPALEATFRLFGLPESDMQGILSTLPHYSAATMRSLPSWPELRLELAPRADLEDLGGFEALVAEVRLALSSYIYSTIRSDSHAAATLRVLQARGATLALAESCTGGLLGALVTAQPGASRTLLLDAVTYANSAKADVLGVPAELLEAHGAVSEPVALAMAQGARRLAGSDVAVATSGIAGPDGGTADRPVGTLCLALVSAAGQETRTLVFKGMSRQRFQEMAAHTALAWLRRWAQP